MLDRAGERVEPTRLFLLLCILLGMLARRRPPAHVDSLQVGEDPKSVFFYGYVVSLVGAVGALRAATTYLGKTLGPTVVASW
jgi:hypothetical protein